MYTTIIGALLGAFIVSIVFNMIRYYFIGHIMSLMSAANMYGRADDSSILWSQDNEYIKRQSIEFMANSYLGRLFIKRYGGYSSNLEINSWSNELNIKDDYDH